jgi:hypothetical protein
MDTLSLTIRKVLVEERLINEGPWDAKEGDLRYWTTLFNQLKSAGLNPKYGNQGKEVTDPKVATSIYSNGWVIRKDFKKNKNFILNIKKKGTNYSAKITSFGGKYAGEDIAKTILSVYNPKTKTAASMTLKDYLSLDDNQFISKLSKSNKLSADTEKVANSVISKLKKAFDMDKDGDYKDYDGTLESDAIAAIYSIKNKNQLDAVNKKIKSLKIATSLKQWVNWEMSDFDPQEYRKLWKHLEGLGYQGANYNTALAAAGIAYDATGGKMLEDVGQALQQLKNLTITDIMEGFRDMLNGVTGGAVQLLLTVFGGPIGAGINMFAWAVLLIWDIFQWVQNKPNWWNLIVDLFSVVTAGVATKFLAPAKSIAAEAKTIPSMMSSLSTKFPTIAKYLKGFAGKLVSLGKSAVNGVKSALGWLSNKLPFLSSWWSKLNGVVGKIGDFVTMIDDSISKTFLGGVTKKITGSLSSVVKKSLPKLGTFLETSAGKELAKGLTKLEKKAIEDYVTGPLRGKSLEYATNYVCKNGTKNSCQTFKQANNYYKIGRDAGKAGKSGTDINKSKSLADIAKSGKQYTKDIKNVVSDIEGA